MLKHILGQTFFQMGILFAFVFGAPKFVPEYWPTDLVNDGRPVVEQFPNDDDPYWEEVGIVRDTLLNHPNPRYA